MEIRLHTDMHIYTYLYMLILSGPATIYISNKPSQLNAVSTCSSNPPILVVTSLTGCRLTSQCESSTHQPVVNTNQQSLTDSMTKNGEHSNR